MSKKKKRVLIIVLVVTLICLYGCNQGQLKINPSAKLYMDLRGIKNCGIYQVGELSNLQYSLQGVSISDSEIESRIDTILKSYEKLITITERDKVKEGDFVNITYTVYCDSKVVNHSDEEIIKIGAGHFNKNIEKSLIGAIKGKRQYIKITVPEDDKNKELAGKEECVQVLINEIQYMHTEQLTTDFVKKNYNLNTIEEFYVYVKKLIKEEREAEVLHEAQENVITKLIKTSKFNLNKDAIVDYALTIYNDYAEMAISYGSSIEEFIKDFFGETIDIFYERCYSESENEIKRILIVGALAESNSIQVTDAEVENALKNAKIEYNSLSRGYLTIYTYQLLEEKVLNAIIKSSL